VTRAKQAIRFVAADSARLVAEWQQIALIAAPAGEEAERAALIAELARLAGADAVEIDRVGNVVATLSGSGEQSLTYLATMDDLASVAAHRQQSDRIAVLGDRLVGPCVETTSSDASALAIIRFAAARPRLFGRLTVAFVLGEETGLSGVRVLCADRGAELGLVVDLMGGVGTISWNAIGFDGVLVEFTTEPRHSLYGGVSEVTDAIARFVTALHANPPAFVHPDSEDPDAVLSVRRVNQVAAGSVFNHSPSTGTVGVDIRSTDPAMLLRLGRQTRALAAQVASEVGVHVTWRDGVQQAAGILPGGRSHRLVRAGAQAVRDVGAPLLLRPWSSSNINAVYEVGLEGIVHDGMRRGGGRGTAGEWADITGVLQGVAADCQLLLMMTGEVPIDTA
jgi:acetylornithine deacetylase/succinyl-diaminopimelate desuccinylase-like protein